MFWKEPKRKLCIECYEQLRGKEDSSITLEITRNPKKCDYCGKEKYIVVEKTHDYIIFR